MDLKKLENAVCNDEKLLQVIKNTSYKIVKDTENRLCIIGFKEFCDLENEIRRLRENIDDNLELSFEIREIHAELNDSNNPQDFEVIDEYVRDGFDIEDTLYDEDDVDEPLVRVFSQDEEESYIEEYGAIILKENGWYSMMKFLQEFNELCEEFDKLSRRECIIYDANGDSDYSGWSKRFGGGYKVVPRYVMEYDKYDTRHYIGIVLEA